MAKATINQTVETGSNLLGEVRNYSRQIWLAGLGAYAKAGSGGLDYLKDLIDAGADLEQQGRERVSNRVETVSSQLNPVRNRLEIIREKVEGQFEKIEEAFDDRVARGLNRLGIPSRKDVDGVSAKLDVLNAMLASANKTN